MHTLQKTVRIVVLEAVLAHFPNPFLIALDVERMYGERAARAVPDQMRRLRADLNRQLRNLKSTNKTKRL
jgi:hypothetical protein